MKTIVKIPALLCAVLLTACGGPSLEKYYVDNQEKENFVVVNVPSSMFLKDDSHLSETNKETLHNIEKANVLAYPLTAENKATFEAEKTELENILKDEKYKLLMKFGGEDHQFRVMYLGDPEAIDEMIVYGASNEFGFGVARILGDNMNPTEIIKLVKSMDSADLDVSGLGNLKEIFQKHKQDSL